MEIVDGESPASTSKYGTYVCLITRGRVWVRAENKENAKEWIHALDPSRMVEESLAQLRTEMEQKDETISDLSASLDRGHEMASKMSNMQNELEMLRAELSSKNSIVSDLVASLVVLNEKVANEALGHRKELETANCENYKLQNTITSLVHAQRSANDELTRLRSELQNKDNKMREISGNYSPQYDVWHKMYKNEQLKFCHFLTPSLSPPQLVQNVADHFEAVNAQIEALRADLATKDQPHAKAKNSLRSTTTINTKKQDGEEVALLTQLQEAHQIC